MSKPTNLQPWLEYFQMLQAYTKKGLLQMQPDKHECYATLTALHAMTPGTDPAEQLRNGAIAKTARRLRVYGAFLSGLSAMGYYKHSFAVHVVGDDEPHDPLYTMLLSRRKHWWRFWQRKDKIEVINYE